VKGDSNERDSEVKGDSNERDCEVSTIIAQSFIQTTTIKPTNNHFKLYAIIQSTPKITTSNSLRTDTLRSSPNSHVMSWSVHAVDGTDWIETIWKLNRNIITEIKDRLVMRNIPNI
jgi:hypothetical protein